jgi:hypothetical protein
MFSAHLSCMGDELLCVVCRLICMNLKVCSGHLHCCLATIRFLRVAPKGTSSPPTPLPQPPRPTRPRCFLLQHGLII